MGAKGVAATLALLVLVFVMIVVVFSPKSQNYQVNFNPNTISSPTYSPPGYSLPTNSPHITANPTVFQEIDLTYSGQSAKYVADKYYGETADEGKVFLSVNIQITNKGYDELNTNPNRFKVFINGIEYGYDSETFAVDKWQTVDVQNGGTFNGVLLFQIPQDASNFKLTYDGYQIYAIYYSPSNSASITQVPLDSQKVTITYSGTFKDYIMASYGRITPDSGYKFLFLQITLQNTGYSEIRASPLYFLVTTNGIKYDYDSWTYSYGNWDTVDVLDGGTFSGTIIYQVPQQTTDYQLTYERSSINYNVNYIKQ